MIIPDKILGIIADIGVEAAKDKIDSQLNDYRAHEKLIEYIRRQEKYNFNCTKEEEIDFEGLATYILKELISDVEKRLFGTQEDRADAREAIANKAEVYASAKTNLSKSRARHIAVTAVDILREYYRKKVPKDLLFVSGETQDAIISSITTHSSSIERKINEVSETIANSRLISVDHNLKLLNEERFDEVEKNYTATIKAISSHHTLNPYYGFALDAINGFKSIPLTKEAATLYPPRLSITPKDLKLGNDSIQHLSKNTLTQSYRQQATIEFDVEKASKYLGNTLDPVQHEAEKMTGAHVILYPPAFPAAFPCSVIADGETVVDYLLLRTKQIEDDAIVITNDEQKAFSFEVVLRINLAMTSFELVINNKATSKNDELKYRLFLQRVARAKETSLKLLNENSILFSTKTSIKPHNYDEKQLALEIDFLRKLIIIEDYFKTSFYVPEEISINDHLLINRLYSMITDGVYCGTCKDIDISLEISDELKQSSHGLINKQCSLAYCQNANVQLFNQKIDFVFFRRIDGIKIKDCAKVLDKIAVLDAGDIIKIEFISSETNSDAHFRDVFYSESAANQLLQSPAL